MRDCTVQQSDCRGVHITPQTVYWRSSDASGFARVLPGVNLMSRPGRTLRGCPKRSLETEKLLPALRHTSLRRCLRWVLLAGATHRVARDATHTLLPQLLAAIFNPSLGHPVSQLYRAKVGEKSARCRPPKNGSVSRRDVILREERWLLQPTKF